LSRQQWVKLLIIAVPFIAGFFLPWLLPTTFVAAMSLIYLLAWIFSSGASRIKSELRRPTVILIFSFFALTLVAHFWLETQKAAPIERIPPAPGELRTV
jgi:hypothetical protein